LRYLFENYVLDTDRREFHCGTDVVSLAPQVFDLLEYLISNRERVVSKDELIVAIWNGRSVSDAAVTTRLNAARTALSDSGEQQRLIKTLPRKGFRFVGSVREAQAPVVIATAVATAEEAPILTPILPDIPSVAVLPFANLSSDPEQEYFADGMVEDIITGLSRCKPLFVIAQHSSFAYKGRAADTRQVGHELGVRYLLQGSVRKSNNRIRLSAQLIDVSTDSRIWADKFDVDLGDLFDLQDRLTSSVVGAISPKIEQAEIERARRKPTESLQAYDFYLRALFVTYQFTREGNAEALRLAKIAISVDPTFALAHALAANNFVQKKGFGWVLDAAGEQIAARELAERATQLDKDDPLVLALSGPAHSFVLEEPEIGAILLARAVALNPNLAAARYWYGWTQIYLGDVEAAIEHFSSGIRLSPLDPRLFLSQAGLAYGQFLAGRYEESLSWAARALQRQPNFPSAKRIAMASLAMAGCVAEARRACVAVLEAEPTLSISGIKTKTPLRRREDIEKLELAYRLAGIPE
jgi:TolB-like protein